MTGDEALLALLTPVVRRLVREELRHAQAEQRWLPAAEAAERLGLSSEAVRRRVLRGQLPGKTLNRKVFVDMAETERLLDLLP